MILSIRLSRFTHHSDRARRLLQLVLAGLALLLLSVWNPISTPGPTVCMSRHAFAIPCPFCGVTRGVSLCLRGKPIEASAWNPLTVPIFILGIGLMIVWVIEYVGNVRLVLRMSWPVRLGLWILVPIVVLANWAYVLTYCREDDFATSWLGQILRLF